MAASYGAGRALDCNAMSPQRPGGVRLLVLGALLCVIGVVLLAVLVSAGLTRPLDVAVIELVRSDRLLDPLSFLTPLTILGSTIAVTVAALLVLIVEIVARRPWLGIAAAATIGLASLLNTGTKDVVQRVRPDLLPPLEIEPGYSFPSGHSALSMVAYGIFALLVVHSSLARPVKCVVITLLGALVLLVGLSRVYLGVHYPSDVLGGWLSGAAIVLLFEALVWSRLAPTVSREASTAPGDAVAGEDRAAPRSDPPGRA
jgi:undecaprenyl-diphosphatase